MCYDFAWGRLQRSSTVGTWLNVLRMLSQAMQAAFLTLRHVFPSNLIL